MSGFRVTPPPYMKLWRRLTPKFILYIRNLKYTHLTIFSTTLIYIHLVFYTCPHKFKWILGTEKPVLTRVFKIYDAQK